VNQPIRYTVMCPHPEGPCHVADLDDDRPTGGGVRVENFRSHSTPIAPRNRLGSRRRVVLACELCPTNVELADTSLADLLDLLGPHRESLDSAMVPVEVPHVDLDELADVLTGGEPLWVVVGEERRYFLPLPLLARAASKLRERS
jgi:hypothetical protein